MLNALLSELGSQFGLGDKADALVRQTLAYVLKTENGGLAGFLNKFEAVGLGHMARSWQGGLDGAQSISPAQLETALGNKGGLIAQLTESLGISRQSVTPALGYALPRLVGALTPNGEVGAVPAAVSAFLGTAAAAGTASNAAAAATGSAALVRWIPWLLLVLASLLVLGWCSQQSGQAARAPLDAQALQAQEAAALASSQGQAAAATAEADAAAAAAAQAEADAAKAAEAPEGAGVVADMVDGSPRLKVYFDVSKAEIAPDFSYAAAGLLKTLKDQPELKAILSGFSDPTGNAAQNAALAKSRAEAVRNALVAEGIAAERIELIKPQEVQLNEGNLAEARRVEVTLKK